MDQPNQSIQPNITPDPQPEVSIEPSLPKWSLTLLIIAGIIVIGIASYATYKYYSQVCCSELDPIVCTLEAKICPDGSSVGRIAPDCEFATCLEIENTKDSPFGIIANFEDHRLYIQDIGITSIRYGGITGVNWALLESRSILEKRQFWGWTWNDELFKDTYEKGIEMSVVLMPNENPVQTDRLDEFSTFVSSAAERYDGDGINDAQGSPVVTYWEIDNEPDFFIPEWDLIGMADEERPWKGDLDTADDYARTLKTAYKAIKSASPSAKVAIGSLALNIKYFEQVFIELEKLKDSDDDVFFDVFNFHFYGEESEYGRNPLKETQGAPQGGPSIGEVKTLLDKYGYSDVGFIITEAGTSSDIAEQQTEIDQAISLVKRYVYPISEGVDRIYWLEIEYNGFLPEVFAHMSLIHKNNEKKLAYYTYKKMVEKLEGSDWDNIEIIKESDNVYVYKFTKANKPIYVAWFDYFDDTSKSKTIILDVGDVNSMKITEAVPKYEIGQQVTDYSTAFNTETKTVDNGEVSIVLTDAPVFIEEN